jgi:hypothetical protein
MTGLEELIKELPPELHQEAEDYILQWSCSIRFLTGGTKSKMYLLDTNIGSSLFPVVITNGLRTTTTADTERTEDSQRTRLFYYPRETARKRSRKNIGSSSGDDQDHQ